MTTASISTSLSAKRRYPINPAVLAASRAPAAPVISVLYPSDAGSPQHAQSVPPTTPTRPLIAQLPDPSQTALRAALIFAAPTAVNIPRAARDPFARLLRVLVEDALVRAPDRTHHPPLAFALRLAIPAGCTAKAMCARIALALKGDWDKLAALPVVRSRQAEPRCQPRARKARHYMVAGNHRKAWAALMAPNTPIDNYSKTVIDLFPPEPPHAQQHAMPITADTVKAAEDALEEHLRAHNLDLKGEVWTAISRIASLSQPGPSGLRAEHLRLAWSADAAFPTSFTALVRAAITGRIVGPTVSQSVLSLVPKANGGARPIGVGEILRRVAGRIVMRALTPQVRPTLEQDGQAVLSRFGTAITYRRILDDAAADSANWILQLDISNAFNTIHRASVLEHAPIQHPIAAALISSLYSSPSDMVVPRMERTIPVTRGVIQGCPLGSLLFATALAPIARQAADGLVLSQRWYADDGHISAADPSTLDTFLGRFVAIAASNGLSVSRDPNKCMILAPVPTVSNALDNYTHLSHLRAVHSLTSLGGPVISTAHPNARSATRTAWEMLAKKSEDTLTLLKEMGDPQYIVSLLTKGGAWSRLRYHVAARPSLFPPDLRLRLDRVELELLAQALGPFGSTLLHDDATAASIRATLPPSLGGLGLLSSCVEADIAASFDPRILDAAEAGDLECVNQISDERDAARRGAHARRQQQVKDVLPPTLRSLFLDLADGSGSNVLSINPSPRDGTLLPRPQASIFLALYLGLPVLPLDHRCQQCQPARRQQEPVDPQLLLCDPYGSHYTGCRSVNTTRHNRVRDVLANLLRRGLPHSSVVIEKALDSFNLPADPLRGARPVDIGYHRPVEDRWVLFDIIIQGVSHLPTTRKPPQEVRQSIASRLTRTVESPIALNARRAKCNQQRSRGVKDVAPLAFGAFGGVDGITRDAFRAMHSALLEHNKGLSPSYLLARVQYAMWSVITTIIARRRTSDPATTLGRAAAIALPRLAAKRGRSPAAAETSTEAINLPLSRLPNSSNQQSDDHLGPGPAASHQTPPRRRGPPLNGTPAATDASSLTSPPTSASSQHVTFAAVFSTAIALASTQLAPTSAPAAASVAQPIQVDDTDTSVDDSTSSDSSDDESTSSDSSDDDDSSLSSDSSIDDAPIVSRPRRVSQRTRTSTPRGVPARAPLPPSRGRGRPPTSPPLRHSHDARSRLTHPLAYTESGFHPPGDGAPGTVSTSPSPPSDPNVTLSC